MFPIFMWVKEYKGLKNFEITFDNNYLINIKDGVLSIERNSDTINISNFYSNNNIEGVNLLIGKNGVGKTSILELLTLENYERYISYECIYFEEINRNTITDFCNLDYFIIYKNYNYGNEFEPDFIIERYSKKKLKNPNKFPQICAEKIGIVKFHFFDENDDKDFFFSNIKKLNSGIKYQSKEKIYTYLNIENKFNKENFENAKMIISIKKDIYSNSEYFNEIKDYLNDNKDIIYSELYDSLLLYKINENDDISNIILKNYCNKLFLREIYYCIEYNKKQKLEEDPINIIKIIKEKIKKKYSNLPKKYLEYFIKNSRKSFLRDFYQKIIDISENMAKLTKNKNIIKVIDNKEIELLKFYVKID